MMTNDLLIELGCEEFPAKILKNAFRTIGSINKTRIVQNNLHFTKVLAYATPRRLAVLVQDLAAQQPDRSLEKRGPAVAAAYTAEAFD